MAEQYATVIGKGMIIKGSVYSKQDMVLNGEVEGVLNLENCRLTIGPTGKVTGNIDSTDKISIRTGGRVEGDIRAAGIIIEDGAHFKGRVNIVTQLSQSKTAGEA